MKSENGMKNYAAALALIFVLGAGLAPRTAAQASVTEEEARAIGLDAYLYFYPLVTMDVTRKQMTNVEAGKERGRGPANAFANLAAYPTADMKVVVRPNFDTLYSTAWLDLTKEPMIVSAPDTQGRYYLLPMLDMWTDVFASPGWRTTGTEANDFLVIPPGWKSDRHEKLIEKMKLPQNIQRIEAPTPYVWIIGRVKTDGPQDYSAVHQIQAGFKITPLSQWGKPAKPAAAKIDPSVDAQTPPKQQVDNMSAGEFFSYAAEVLKAQPPHLTDQPILARLRRIGFEVGKSFDLEKQEPAVARALADAPRDAQKVMEWKLPTLARVVNGWSMNTDTMGVYGNYYLKRAIIARLGLGANLPEDAVYPVNLGDASGRPLDGTKRYRIHFEKSELPPVDALWSITLYDDQGYQVANPLNRFALSSWMPLNFNSDGSLDLYFQSDSPGAEKEANWLPAPKTPFNLTMRLYAPKQAVLTGEWAPPPVTKEGGADFAPELSSPE